VKDPGLLLDAVYRQCSEETIPKEYAIALHESVKRYRPRTVVEIGLANGASAVAIASALACNGGGRLISIDPNQRQGYEGRGLAALAQSGLAGFHELMEEPSYLALPELLRRGVKAEFAYIDGWHSFDYVVVDFFYVDKLLVPGGVQRYGFPLGKQGSEVCAEIPQVPRDRRGPGAKLSRAQSAVHAAAPHSGLAGTGPLFSKTVRLGAALGLLCAVLVRTPIQHVTTRTTMNRNEC
jgi:hypothetical protein